jgi:hypothetical protein
VLGIEFPTGVISPHLDTFGAPPCPFHQRSLLTPGSFTSVEPPYISGSSLPFTLEEPPYPGLLHISGASISRAPPCPSHQWILRTPGSAKTFTSEEPPYPGLLSAFKPVDLPYLWFLPALHTRGASVPWAPPCPSHQWILRTRGSSPPFTPEEPPYPGLPPSFTPMDPQYPGLLPALPTRGASVPWALPVLHTKGASVPRAPPCTSH